MKLSIREIVIEAVARHNLIPLNQITDSTLVLAGFTKIATDLLLETGLVIEVNSRMTVGELIRQVKIQAGLKF